MARQNLPQGNPMFSKLFAIALLIVSSISAISQTRYLGPPVTTNQNPLTITAHDVFIPASGLWVFHNGYGDQTNITIWFPGPSDFLPTGTIFWSYDKSACRAYWQPGVCGAHLDFALAPQLDGSFTSPASLITFPNSCPFCTGGWTQLTADLLPVGDGKIPFLIIPASATEGHISVVDTDYFGYNRAGIITGNSIIPSPPPPVPMVHWRTSSYIEGVTTPSFSGKAMVSEQWEGPCFDASGNYAPQPGCAHEKWYFAPALGLVKVMFLNGGAGETTDRNIDMVR